MLNYKFFKSLCIGKNANNLRFNRKNCINVGKKLFFLMTLVFLMFFLVLKKKNI